MENIEPFTMHYLRNFVIFFILFHFTEFTWGREIYTLSTGQTLNDGDFLFSVKRAFTLGFFSIGMSQNRYVGIYFTDVPENRIVWVANRDNPISNLSGVVSFHTPNNLVVHASDLKNPIWSTGFLGTGKKYSARLLDTGNLVIFEEDKGVIAWQSFDHPTDTLLPNMKLGVNRKTGLNWSLTSWKSIGDPGIGEYSFRMDVIRDFSELSLYDGSSRIWRVGPLNGARLGEISPMYFFNVTYVDNEDGVYMTYGMPELSTLSVVAMTPFGVMRMSEWKPDMRNWTIVWTLPRGPCDQYNLCGPNRYCEGRTAGVGFECLCFPGFESKKIEELRDREGCTRKRDDNVCRNREGFIKLSRMKMPDTTTTRVDMKRGLKECEEECLRDCNCMAFTNSTEMGIVCVMWYGNLLDTRTYETGGQDLFVRVDAVELAQYGKKQQRHPSSNKKRKVAAVVTSVGVVAFTVVFILCWLTHKRKGGLLSRTEQRHGNLLNDPDKSTEQLVDRQKNGDLPFFDLISLVEATNNFSHENKLGEGGFGSVYKGTLKNGQEIAVKRLSETSKQGLQEFKNEATLIAKHTHRNLVRLLGCCAQQEEKLLIYEFMPNKSLDSLIFDKTKKACLDWEQRFSIIMGIVRGMVYLHHDCSVRIIHRDLKASNVLLDAQMNPKISDFGMARFFEGDQVEGNTNRVVGTYGYMSPEYAADGTFSIKSDVFSFGVLLLEIITGTKNKSYYNNDGPLNLISKVWHLWREGRALEIVDSSLGGDYSANTVLRCIHVGLLSLQAQAIHRPTMSDIAVMLSYETDLPTPREPGFYFNNLASDQHASSSTVGMHSVNEITISVIEPR